ncbi:gliding motility-associated peptidyl-prolyl isomerase GldI [Tenacibaculum sp. TC6]|uniref:gliding motility-associated peptidyl-prolyl isomerase GldI n=1 Tax=Tenacibaculum sp. TC6 TaxID=3423223 RepID=UPI003D36E4F7
MKYKSVVILVVFVFFSCSEQKARKPKKHGTQNFYKEVIQSNKKLNKLQKERLELWIAKDTVHNYKVSPKGYWYYYVNKDSLQTATPKLNDIVEIEFNIADIYGKTIYDLQRRTYKVDKEDFIPALQDGIKLMKKGETITFVIPSYSAFGVTGDGNKIGINKPIQSTLTLVDIKKQINNNENN